MDRRSFILGAAAAVATCRQAPAPRSYLQRIIDEYGDGYSDFSSLMPRTPPHADLDLFASRIALYANIKGMHIDGAGHLFLWRGAGDDPWGRATPAADGTLNFQGGADHAEPGEGYLPQFGVGQQLGPEHYGCAEHDEGNEFGDHS